MAAPAMAPVVAAGLMDPGKVHAELGQVVAGLRPGRTSREEITLFDSTGTAVQDVVAAAAVYQSVADSADVVRFDFNS